MRFRVRIESLLTLTISMNAYIYIALLSTNIKTNTETRRFPKHRPSMDLKLCFHGQLKHCKLASLIPILIIIKFFFKLFKLTGNGSNLSSYSLA